MSEPASIEDRQEAAALKAEGAAEILRRFANDPEGASIPTESGLLPTLKQWLKDHAAAIGNVLELQDRVAGVEQFDVDIQTGDGSKIGFLQSGFGAVKRSVMAKLNEFVTRNDFNSDADFNLAKANKLSRDAQGRLRTQLFIAGTEELVGSSIRDAFVVGRNVEGATDCHAFADRTVLKNVTDYGGYGTFDGTTKVEGAHTQNHVFSFQDRTNFGGSGNLQNQAGLYSRPIHSGSGVIDSRRAVDIYDVTKTGTGTVTEQIGILIRDLVNAVNNVAFNIAQTTGYAIFAPGGAPSYHKGQLRIGANADIGAQISAQDPTGVGAAAWMSGTASAARIGGTGNFPLQVFTNGAVRLEILSSTNSYTVRPGADNTQPLGDVTKRWAQLYAGTATISTSDAREKTAVRALTALEIAAAKDLAKEIGAFRFLASFAEKGGSAREHIGMTVQRAIEVMESHGLDPFGYSFICYDEWEAESEVRGFDGEVEREAMPAGNRYSFRFEGLLAFIVAGFEARLAALEQAL